MEEEPDAPSLVELLQHTVADQHLSAPDLSSQAAQDYLDTLQALPLKHLLAEAGAITDAASAVESELTNLCYREYPTFISVHKCSAAVTSAFDDFSSSLGRLLDAVPALEDECRTFVRSTAGVQDARAKAALVQEHQDKLFDLLEIPQLMDTCVRNGYYQEALELRAHTASLLQRYPDVELVQDVAKEVGGVLQLMLAQLLALLRETIKLPALVKTVGYLRRLSIIGEDELGLAFLVSRLSNFRTQLGVLERDRPDPVRYVRKYVDLFREHVFDIISQFSAIFESTAGAAQLASFVGQCVDELVSVVATNVPKMNDAASLSSILVQLGYCALAFARVGLDFSTLVTDPFADAVSSAFVSVINDATKDLNATLEQAEKGSGSPAAALLAHEALPALLSADSPLSFVPWSGSLDTLPDLAKFPPLAILVNAHLSALNSLRLLAPLHLHPALASAQCAALAKCTHAVAQYVRQAVAMSDTVNPRSGHKRSNSTRAALIRKNTETLLTPEARAARRHEAQRTCAAFADAWGQAVVPLLRTALDTGVFEEELDDSAELRETLDTLNMWVHDQDVGPESPVNGGPHTPNGSGAATPIMPGGIVAELGEMTALERVASRVRSPSPVKAASPVRSPSPVKAASPARSPSPAKELPPAPPSPTKAASAFSPVTADSPSPNAPTPARSLSPVNAQPFHSPAERFPSPPKSPVKEPPSPETARSPSPSRSPIPFQPSLLAPQFSIDTPSAVGTPAVATPAAPATPAVETPPRVSTPEPEQIAGGEVNADSGVEVEPKMELEPEAGSKETAQSEVTVESTEPAAPKETAESKDTAEPKEPVALKDTVELKETAEPQAETIESKESSSSKAGSKAADKQAAEPEPKTEEKSERATPPTDTTSEPPVVNGAAEVAERSSAAPDAAAAVETAADTVDKPSHAAVGVTSSAPATPPATSAPGPSPSVTDTSALAPAPDASPVATPATLADGDDNHDESEPSRPPSPPGAAAAAPSTSGGGKKKKKKNKKKK
ncbi:hypothetical protein CspeluHIS016_0111600 [Cutaneotrichosporon spelunceum]|uniref:Conserved oligomeric Golgi complex subunit 8 n=1 Tax=Cutaneotrichosporon spelunceum TaxID=1672016 RepID=A0AAD3TQ48_9TREE|nr:hypothetical protein CspeluHIS016_0111600 [Cutaneotrichosporon spelunceum]